MVKVHKRRTQIQSKIFLILTVQSDVNVGFFFCTRSPSKSAKKLKAFKFPTKSKEKREKSREKVEVKEKDLSEVKDKKKEKDKEKKEKKEKSKDKDKKDKKLKQSSVSEEMLELGGKSHLIDWLVGSFLLKFIFSSTFKMRSPYSVFLWDCPSNGVDAMMILH